MAKRGSRRRLVVRLKKKDSERLGKLLAGGIESVRVVKRAQALRLLAAGERSPQVARAVGLTPKGVRNIGWRYVQGGWERALYEAPRPGAERRLTESEEQQVVAMVCADAPEGRARWTVRLITEEAVKRKVIPRVGRETIRILLRDHDLKPWREKKVVRGRTDPGIRGTDGRRSGAIREAL